MGSSASLLGTVSVPTLAPPTVGVSRTTQVVLPPAATGEVGAVTMLQPVPEMAVVPKVRLPEPVFSMVTV